MRANWKVNVIFALVGIGFACAPPGTQDELPGVSGPAGDREPSHPFADRWTVVIDAIGSENISEEPQKFKVQGRVFKGKDCPGSLTRGADVLIYTKDVAGGNLQLQKDRELPNLANIIFPEKKSESGFEIPIWLGGPEDHRHSYDVYAFVVCGAGRAKLQAVASATHNRYFKASEIWAALEHEAVNAEPLTSTPAYRVRRSE